MLQQKCKNIDVNSEVDSNCRLEQLVLAVNDLMESRIDANLKIVSNVLLVNLPEEPG